MFVQILRSYDIPEILMLAAASLCVFAGIAYVLGTL